MNTNVPLVPGACIVKSAVDPDTVIEINRIIDTRLSEIANIENVQTHDIARLCAAWSQQADWVNEICQNLTGKLLNAIEKSGIQPHDNYHPIGCELFTSWLSTYLRLAEYGARPNAEIWLDVRDTVIPFLRSLRNRSI